MTIVIDEQDVKDRVAAGATVLDRVHPGWEYEVDPENITVASQVTCPLGQVYGTWLGGLARLEEAGIEVDDKGTALGFQSVRVHSNPCTTPYDITPEENQARWAEYGLLNAHWRNEVENRRRPLRRKKAMNLW